MVSRGPSRASAGVRHPIPRQVLANVNEGAPGAPRASTARNQTREDREAAGCCHRWLGAGTGAGSAAWGSSAG